VIHGKNIIGFDRSALSKKSLKSFNPKENKELSYRFYVANDSEINLALDKAKKAFEISKDLSTKRKAEFLNRIADELLADESIIELAMQETALPEARIRAERNRTAFQCRNYADAVLTGYALEVSIDTAIPDRQPLPKPDLRKMNSAIGPVLVFAAGNFPLAYSVSGGDTTSAIAAGNPVIVKAHSGHMATSEAVAEAIIRAAKACNMPDGIFSMLHGEGRDLGQKLVQASEIKACGFTGSLTAGRTLFDLASKRKDPIPVFAEMGSINPVFIFPSAVQNDSKKVASQLAASITLHAGQYCTNPGLMIGLAGQETDTFLQELSSEIAKIQPQSMLNLKTYQQFCANREKLLNENKVNKIAVSASKSIAERHEAESIIAQVDALTFLKNQHLHQEVFGPFSLFILCQTKEELQNVANSLDGQLTASLYASDEEMYELGSFISILQEKAGRLLFNSVPTGVEVCASQQHGGPYPASTDSRFSSVGWSALKRFMRPIAYQNFPENQLPDACKNKNILGIWRLVNGNYSKDSIV
jgi:NADP-dependent aldehyde dehydrogenase